MPSLGYKNREEVKDPWQQQLVTGRSVRTSGGGKISAGEAGVNFVKERILHQHLTGTPGDQKGCSLIGEVEPPINFLVRESSAFIGDVELIDVDGSGVESRQEDGRGVESSRSPRQLFFGVDTSAGSLMSRWRALYDEDLEDTVEGPGGRQGLVVKSLKYLATLRNLRQVFGGEESKISCYIEKSLSGVWW
ncbi:hypothetical protein ElyMa_000689200 [Elysia marginata]|uniref:Uncharacterized protein n=1 Tax=Elysia marginata TaxID=1093978 RepID=A0AAV4GHG9_9GAST|nr:hypothetical protein ElyMa_000689200 [Elysia marginata]